MRRHAPSVRPTRAGLLTLVLLFAACDGGGEGGRPLDLPRLEWSWVDVPGAVCGDGSPTGLAVNPGPEGSTDVLVFLMGGGACWNAATCNGTSFSEPTASAGPYGAAQFQADATRTAGTILDRTVERSPAGNATLVFIPYCTGDVHWGDAGSDYGWQHRGGRNLALDAEWLAANLPEPSKLVVSGSSAGGFGSLLAHDLLRARWPGARGFLIDDSGPPLVGSDINLALRASWYLAWGLDQTLTPFCGAACRDDFSQAIGALREKYPDDRIALLSSRQDQVIRAFFGVLPADVFEESLLELVDARFAAQGDGIEAFLVEGDDHVLLEDVGAWSADGTSLTDWIRQMVDEEDVWSTLGRDDGTLPALR